MKNTNKVFGIAAVIMLIFFGITFALSACRSKKSTPYPLQTFTSIEELREFLSNQKTNKPETSYRVKLNINDDNMADLKTVLQKRDKYIFLDLSDSTITTIPGSAFGEYNLLTGIIIPNSVINIEPLAFKDSTKLTGITIPDSVTGIGYLAFWGCTGLAEVTIGNSVTDIGVEVFSQCRKLTSITIPNSLTNIDARIFSEGYGLTEINVDSGNSAYTTENGILYSKDKTILCVYPAGKKDSSFTIPDNVKTIGSYAFSYSKKLTGINIPDSVTIIEEGAFYRSAILSVTVPDSVTGIGDFAFWDCTGLTNINIPNSVTDIGENVFFSCTGLTAINVNAGNKVYSSKDGILYNKDKTFLYKYPAGKKDSSFTIPDSVISIEENAFSGCAGLTGITIPKSVKNINGVFQKCTGLAHVTIINSVVPKNAFDHCTITDVVMEGVISIEEEAFYFCKWLKKVTLPDSLISIGDHAFEKCYSLTNITIPKSVTGIGGLAFHDCYNLAEVTIGNSVEYIADHAFSGCLNLTGVIIPNSVTIIRDWAFSGCRNLTGVIIGNRVEYIGDYAFSECVNLTSVTFEGNNKSIELYNTAFLGNLREKFYEDAKNGTQGTYTTTAPVNENSKWTRQP